MNAAANLSAGLLVRFETDTIQRASLEAEREQKWQENRAQLRSGQQISNLPFGGTKAPSEQSVEATESLFTNSREEISRFQAQDSLAMEAGGSRRDEYMRMKDEGTEQDNMDTNMALFAASTEDSTSDNGESNDRRGTYGFYPASSVAAPGMDGAKQIACLQSALAKRLGPEYISTRAGPSGGGKLSYLEGWKVIDLANEVFGFNGWSSTVMKLDIDYMDELPNNRFNVGVSSIVRITLRDGTFHEDVGYGMSDNSPRKGAALEKAKKEAVTDALKRATRTFGRLLGNCMYDKKFVDKASKMRPQAPQYDIDNLKRAPNMSPTCAAGSNANEQQKMSSGSRSDVNANASDSKSAPPIVSATDPEPMRETSNHAVFSSTKKSNLARELDVVTPGVEQSCVDETAAKQSPSEKNKDGDAATSSMAADLEKKRRLAAANRQKEKLLQKKKEEEESRMQREAEKQAEREQQRKAAYIKGLEEQARAVQEELVHIRQSQQMRAPMNPPSRNVSTGRMAQPQRPGENDSGIQSRHQPNIECRPQTAQLLGYIDDSAMLAIKEEDLNAEARCNDGFDFGEMGEFDSAEAEAESMAIDFDVEAALAAREDSLEKEKDDSGVCFPAEEKQGKVENHSLAKGNNGHVLQRDQIRHQLERSPLKPIGQPEAETSERPRSKGRFMNPDEADDNSQAEVGKEDGQQGTSPLPQANAFIRTASFTRAPSHGSEKASNGDHTTMPAPHASRQTMPSRSSTTSPSRKIDMTFVARGKPAVLNHSALDIKPVPQLCDQRANVRSFSKIRSSGESSRSSSSILSSSPNSRKRDSSAVMAAAAAAAAAKRGRDSMAEGVGRITTSPDAKKSRTSSANGSGFNTNSFSRSR